MIRNTTFFYLYWFLLITSVSAIPATKTDYKTSNIYVNSIPNCGTHLLTKCVRALTGREEWELTRDLVKINQLPPNPTHAFFVTHVYYSKEAAAVFARHKFKTILIIRDLRDQVISKTHWLVKGGWNGSQLNNHLRLWSFDDILTYFIKRVKPQYNGFLPWRNDPSCLMIKFEDLVGPKGGGSLKAQKEVIKKIAKHLEVPLTKELLKKCTDTIYGDSPTFRKGKIGSWAEEFQPHHKELFKKEAGQLLIDLGYEKDLAW